MGRSRELGYERYVVMSKEVLEYEGLAEETKREIAKAINERALREVGYVPVDDSAEEAFVLQSKMKLDRTIKDKKL